MNSIGSVTHWLHELEQNHSDQAATEIWNRYFDRLARVIREQMISRPMGVADESDVALSVLNHFFSDLKQGRFDKLENRDQLWRLLVVIAKRKSIDLIRHENAKRRGSGKLTSYELMDIVCSEHPTPQFAIELVDELRHLLTLLGQHDSTMALVVTKKYEGFTKHEIASKLSISIRTVERKLNRAEILWNEDIEKRDTPNP